jgi:hypothetical protein
MSLTHLHMSLAAAANTMPASSTSALANPMPFFHHENKMHSAAAAAAVALTQSQHYPSTHYQPPQLSYLNYHYASQLPTAIHQRQTFAIHDLLGLGNTNSSTSIDHLFPHKFPTGNPIYYPNAASDPYDSKDCSHQAFKLMSDTSSGTSSSAAAMAVAAYGAYLERRFDFVNLQNGSQNQENAKTNACAPICQNENSDNDENSRSDCVSQSNLVFL